MKETKTRWNFPQRQGNMTIVKHIYFLGGRSLRYLYCPPRIYIEKNPCGRIDPITQFPCMCAVGNQTCNLRFHVNLTYHYTPKLLMTKWRFFAFVFTLVNLVINIWDPNFNWKNFKLKSFRSCWVLQLWFVVSPSEVVRKNNFKFWELEI